MEIQAANNTKKEGSVSLSYGFSSFMTQPLSYGAPYSYDIQVPHMAHEIQDRAAKLPTTDSGSSMANDLFPSQPLSPAMKSQ